MKREYGLQMYSVRDFTNKDMDYALKEVAAMGYDYVEFAGFMGHSAEAIAEMLDKYGITCRATHTGWLEVRDDFENTVKYHKTIGNKNIIVPGGDFSTKEKLDEFIDFVNEFGPKLAAEGITLGYHNHSHEFKPNADGLYIHAELEKRTDVEFEIDTYWAFAAGLDPVATLERLKNRIRFIHLKDGDGGHKGFSLGMGVAPVKAVRKYAIEHGLNMVVESETLDPDGLSEVRRCIEFLRECDAAE